jgi:cyclopropane-fatty-acyl-phospholipid synthase
MEAMMGYVALDDDSQAVLRQTPPVFRAAARLLARSWAYGALEFVLPSGQSIRLHGPQPGPQARLSVRNFRFMRRVFASGAIGFAEGYMAGEWDTPDLAQLLEVMSLNFDLIQKLVDGNPLMRLVHEMLHNKRRNTREGARRNIHAHYDLGEAFYGAWLDPSMTYSSAVFSPPGASLQAAQEAKYAALARSISIGPQHHVLEIGCGWGGFAEHVAGAVGARYTGITISKAQAEYAKKRMFEQGLADRAEILLTDYRDVQGCFDRVASIEMFEAVGEAYWPTYFAKLSEVLTPGGLAGLQIITIKDELFSHYRRNTDFIQKYVFPGGMLPSETRLMQEVASAGLTWTSAARYGQDYAATLSQWASRFQAAWRAITDLGFDERFRRLWLFYLSYCEAGFRTGRTDVIQVSLQKA